MPFLLIFASGYFYVGFGSLYAMYKMHQEATATVVVEHEVQEVQTSVAAADLSIPDGFKEKK